MTEFRSTHPTRGCDILIEVIYVAAVISIHAPHEGVRRGGTGLSRKGNVISIHAPHEGVRRERQVKQQRIVQFQSTHPTRGCDFPAVHVDIVIHHFNPRTPRGGATEEPNEAFDFWEFQSTHPTRGCDGVVVAYGVQLYRFQSTHPTRGCDKRKLMLYQYGINFNPRTPRGGATAICCSLISRVTTCCRPNITPLLDVVRFLNYCTNLLLFLGEPPRLFRTASGSPMSLHY